MTASEPIYLDSFATFDDERIYRYSLVRRWAPGPTCLWIMLNPSTADETKLDPTLRRCLGFTRSWIAAPVMWPGTILESQEERFGAFEVCNLYALRATDPRDLWRPLVDPVSGSVKTFDPVGPNNDAAIQSAAKQAALVIVGWGCNAKPDRERRVAQLLADIGVQPRALGCTRSGSPGHPLYIRGDVQPVPWHARGLR